ncbi:PerC family transcriptional regulator [Klebsiella aerogenes]|uniref:PerC family transcriptional regulator n=1 Tax=Klebsiella aerogenes TaxID=548 RepID=UPI00067AAEC8|nr:PerC family transcriptional regulator [Klebsiella aerogenes]
MENEALTPVADKLAESLENAGLYRRAATRWLQVFFECLSDSERSWVSRRRLFCLSQIQIRKPDDGYLDVYRAVNALHRKMGLEQTGSIPLRRCRSRGQRK